MVGSSRTKNRSEESKKEVLCELCGKKIWIDIMKSKQFLKVHSGKPYQERGDSQRMITFLTATKRIVSGDEDKDSSEAPVETALYLEQSYEEETYEENSPGNKKKFKGNKNGCKTNIENLC